MAWIRVVREEAAEGRLKEAYDRIVRAIGRVIPFYRVYSPNPRLLHAHLDYYGAVSAPSALATLRKEYIAVAVSAENGCQH
jgi:alkylhydroperoxidase family enzyme